MAEKIALLSGLSRFFVADYSYDSETKKATFANGVRTGGAVSYSVTDNSPAAVEFYMDNQKKVSKRPFVTGTLTHTSGGLIDSAVEFMLNMVEKTMTVGDKEYKYMGYPAEPVPKFKAFGTIEEEIIETGEFRYRPIILPKVQYENPGRNATTRGQTLTMTGKQMTATVFVEEETREWLWDFLGEYKTEAEAEEVLKVILKVTEGSTATA